MRRSTIALFAIATAFVLLAIFLRAGETDTPTATTTAPVDTTTSEPPTTVPLTTTTTLPFGTSVCDLYTGVATSGRIESTDLVEASGLAASRSTPDVLWSHNDSRGTATLFAFTIDGEDLGAYEVPRAFALDWEDMSAGPGPSGDAVYLYVGDIGDNFDIRGGLVTVYRVPDVNPAELDESFPESTALTYQYPDGTHNAEALFIDPVEPALYLITKNKEEAFVFRGSIEPTSGPMSLELVATLFLGAEVSGADMSADGTTLALRGYSTVWLWHRNPGESVAHMLAEDPCTAPSPEERQGESITLDENFTYWTISEGSTPEIFVVARDR